MTATTPLSPLLGARRRVATRRPRQANVALTPYLSAATDLRASRASRWRSGSDPRAAAIRRLRPSSRTTSTSARSTTRAHWEPSDAQPAEPELLHRLPRRCRAEGGYVMVTVMGVLLVATLFSVAAMSAADNDTPPVAPRRGPQGGVRGRRGGLNYYLYRLNEDSNFWAPCTNVEGPSATEPAPVNQPWNGTGPDPRRWRNVPGLDRHAVHDRAAADERIAVQPGRPRRLDDQPEQRARSAIRATGRSRRAPRRGSGRTARSSARSAGAASSTSCTSPTSRRARPRSTRRSGQAWASGACASTCATAA